MTSLYNLTMISSTTFAMSGDVRHWSEQYLGVFHKYSPGNDTM